MRIIVASHNPSKISEISELLCALDVEVVGLNELGLLDDIEENGQSFIENAQIKAQAIAELFPDDMVIADDSGICIAAFDMGPGIHSARFLKECSSYYTRNQKVLELLEGADTRKAFFVCAIHIIHQGHGFDIQEAVYGRIADAIAGEGGFGYDPIFIPDGFEQTFAQLPKLKENISHRAKALKKVVEYVQFLY